MAYIKMDSQKHSLRNLGVSSAAVHSISYVASFIRDRIESTKVFDVHSTFSDGGDRALQISPGVYDERAILGMGLRNGKLYEVTRQQTLVGCRNGGILWVSGQSHDAQLVWMEQWITSHWQDARTILKKPVVLAEFGKSTRGQGSRDTFMSSGYRNIYNLAKPGRTMAGGVVSQLMAHGMENYDDGYCIPSTTNWPFHADTIINL
ncbi:Mannan endo-1,4-beta-mannosidase 5 [Capsicum chinense]|nr:Mannan endo-1,4-beta-mannosidase 5 [Capsicum chinense]